ncbi:inactive protein RESTRICTED TEV MOVEMENT 1-like [Rhododendron vialii]|uniref:inactive protein RESTRICTED TEV MOVEMENT 1-like n=1 Tax=Rhododendron vialii TaxID=182163 RepID=UPI00265D64FA|nr:inactive protein RESTRICTED TEV MOVEMENT 1-like [Rhododendron vialii]
MIKIGPPHFTTDGKAWDDGGRDKIVQIFIEHDQHSIISLQFLYAENGNLVSSDKDGGDRINTPKFDVVNVQVLIFGILPLKGDRPLDQLANLVTLNCPSEYITGISGCHGRIYVSYWQDLILSITFITNNRTYGPFGGRGNDSVFQYQLGPDRSFGGFHAVTDPGI